MWQKAVECDVEHWCTVCAVERGTVSCIVLGGWRRTLRWCSIVVLHPGVRRSALDSRYHQLDFYLGVQTWASQGAGVECSEAYRKLTTRTWDTPLSAGLLWRSLVRAGVHQRVVKWRQGGGESWCANSPPSASLEHVETYFQVATAYQHSLERAGVHW